jgi:small subunit ribosomal protein S20
MANTKSAKKNVRKTARRTIRNQAVVARLKTLAKQSRAAAIGTDLTQAKAIARTYIAAMDKAVKTGVIHANKAAHAKSSLAKILTPAAPKK